MGADFDETSEYSDLDDDGFQIYGDEDMDTPSWNSMGTFEMLASADDMPMTTDSVKAKPHHVDEGTIKRRRRTYEERRRELLYRAHESLRISTMLSVILLGMSLACAFVAVPYDPVADSMTDIAFGTIAAAVLMVVSICRINLVTGTRDYDEAAAAWMLEWDYKVRHRAERRLTAAPTDSPLVSVLVWLFLGPVALITIPALAYFLFAQRVTYLPLSLFSLWGSALMLSCLHHLRVPNTLEGSEDDIRECLDALEKWTDGKQSAICEALAIIGAVALVATLAMLVFGIGTADVVLIGVPLVMGALLIVNLLLTRKAMIEVYTL